jgi:methionine biosynthesis protein MetW
MTTPSPNSALATSYDARRATYSTFGNGSLLDVVRDVLPANGSVLDIGCASGGLLAALAGSAGRRVGIEISQAAAAAAREVADEVFVGDIADPELDLGPDGFDVIVLADVLEHTADPTAALAQALRFCAPQGKVVVSVPNVAHWIARVQLARGKWDYVESGLLDRGHLRFFTRSTILAELQAAGLRIERVESVVPRLVNHLPIIDRLPGRLRAMSESAWQRLGARRPEAMAYQLMVVAQLP